jgi:DNA-binding transcriptional regulator YdaS (Cro superfamily)
MESEAQPLAALEQAIRVIGSQSATGRLLGVSQAAVWRWLHNSKVLPAEFVLKVERATGISRHDLRPDVYGPAPCVISSDDIGPMQ